MLCSRSFVYCSAVAFEVHCPSGASTSNFSHLKVSSPYSLMGELRFPQLHLLYKHQFLLRRLNHLFHQPLPNLCLNRIRILGAFNDVQSLPSKCLDGLPVHGVLGNAFECVEGRGVEIYQPWTRLGDVVHTSDAGGPFGCSEDGGPAHYCRGVKLLIRTSARAKRRAGACQ